MPPGTKLDLWPDLEAAWKKATEVDGAGFVASIAHGANPFGESANFLTHYTGWLKTDDKKLNLYTISSDASFVLVGDKFEFGWPGEHGPNVNAKTVTRKEVNTLPGATRIDYYHAAKGSQAPTMVLGHSVGGKDETIPASAWLHPGTTEIIRLENVRGAPVPVIDAHVLSYLGWNGLWLYEIACKLDANLPAGWSATWEWSDGSAATGAKSDRVVPGPNSVMATVRLKGDQGEVRGVRRITFGGAPPRQAQTENANDLRRYLGLLEGEDPERLAPDTLRAGFQLLSEFGNDQQIGRWAGAWMAKNTNQDDPLWIKGKVAHLRALAQTSPQQALAEIRHLDFGVRRKFARELGLIELELLVFYLKDPAAAQVANRLAFENPNSDVGRLAKIRLGDLYRLLGRGKDAVEVYRSVQKTIADETQGRKFAAQDRSYSITIADLLAQDYRHEAEAKLAEWELEHPMAKFDSDFLLLRGRVLMEFGRWNEALQEIDSFREMNPDSPFQIPADFYRAKALWELGKKDEARTIWQRIAKEFPKHELAAESSRLANQK
jgi:tetratricopeptide (TPR) repeat protein